MRLAIVRSAAVWSPPILAVSLLVSLAPAAVHGGSQDPAQPAEAPAKGTIAVGTAVVLKTPGTPIFDSGRQVPSDNDLFFTVEETENDRLLVTSRDGKRRGWVFREQAVPLETAADYFADALANDHRDVDALWMRRGCSFTATSSTWRCPILTRRFASSPIRPGCTSLADWSIAAGSSPTAPSKTATRQSGSTPDRLRPTWSGQAPGSRRTISSGLAPTSSRCSGWTTSIRPLRSREPAAPIPQGGKTQVKQGAAGAAIPGRPTHRRRAGCARQRPPRIS